MRKMMTLAAALMIALALGGCSDGGDTTSGSSGSDDTEAVEVQETEAQVFETDAATVEYREEIEPTAGNVMFNFALTNKTDSTVMVTAEHVVINDQFDVKTLGGAATPIGPGNTGSVSITFGYTVQTTLESMDQIESASMELVMIDDSSYDEVARIPVSIVL